jgi:hypothetical protein
MREEWRRGERVRDGGNEDGRMKNYQRKVEREAKGKTYNRERRIVSE